MLSWGVALGLKPGAVEVRGTQEVGPAQLRDYWQVAGPQVRGKEKESEGLLTPLPLNGEHSTF